MTVPLTLLVSVLASHPAVKRASPAPSLNPTEVAISKAANDNLPASLELLERLVNINSGTFNFEGVRKVGDVLRQELDALGFQTRWADGVPFGRAGHLIAER